jgi:mitochondrial fission protein ELM1
MQDLSMQAYDAYSKTMREALLEASEKLKIQADKAQKDLSVIATKFSQEGQEYLVMAARNSPNSDQGHHNSVQSSGRLYWPSEYEDYHVGILFGMSMFYIGEIFNAN